MRDRRDIEKEIFAARSDLEDRIIELRRFMRAKADLRSRARLAVAKRPVKFAVIVGVVIGTLATLVLARRWATLISR